MSKPLFCFTKYFTKFTDSNNVLVMILGIVLLLGPVLSVQDTLYKGVRFHLSQRRNVLRSCPFRGLCRVLPLSGVGGDTGVVRHRLSSTLFTGT